MDGTRVGDWTLVAAPAPAGRGHAAPARHADGRSGDLTLFDPAARLDRLDLAGLRKLDHPNVVRLLDAGTHEGRPFLVAERTDGTDYEARLRAGDRPGWAEVLDAALQIVAGLHHGHRRGLLHGDLRPGNVARAADGTIRLRRFGWFNLFPDDAPALPAAPLDSASFLPPEVAQGKPPGKRSDFYALGGTLYALLAGRPPFRADAVAELIRKHCYAVPDRPAHFVTDLPDDLDALVMKLLEKQASQRPGSGQLLIAELERIRGDLERRGRLARGSARTVVVEEGLPPGAGAEPLVPRANPSRVLRNYAPLLQLLGLTAVVVAIVLAFGRSGGPTPDDRFAAAEPLLKSDDPADWERAWAEHLQPLAEEHPDYRPEEVRTARHLADAAAELKRARLAEAAAKARPEAERRFQAGLALLKAGDRPAARRAWQDLADAAGVPPADRPWVVLARAALDRYRIDPGP